MIPIGKFGFVVLNIKMNPAKVDVNVHPAKLEVRFEEENKVFQAIYHTIKDTLLKDDLVANTEKTNIIIQNNDKIQSFDDLKSIEEKHSTGGLFGWKKKSKQIENYTNEESKIKTNIIEDLYMDKKQNETKLENNSEEKVDNLVDTSDVLNQLKNMQEKIKQEKENVEEKQDLKVMEETKENVEQKIPIGVNYTYFGENKEKVESLLRQLHPNIYNNTENKEEQTIETKQIDEVKQEENNIIKEENNKIETNNDNFIENKIQDNNNDIKENVVVNEQNDEEQGKKENEDSNYEITKKFKELKNQLDEQQSQITPEFKEMYQKLFGTKIEDEPKEEKEQQDNLDAVDIVKDNVSMFENIGTYQKPAYKFIGIVFKTYIIVEIDKEMYIIDQHAAHERIMYEKVKKNYYSNEEKDSQLLLLPDVITLTHKEMDIAKENMDIFEKAGFSLEEFGENTIKLTGVPDMCLDLDTKELFLAVKKHKTLMNLDGFLYIAGTTPMLIITMVLMLINCVMYTSQTMNGAEFIVNLLNYLIPTLLLPIGTALLAMILDKKPIKPMIKGLLAYPLFMGSWLLINFKCLFKRDLTWEKINHVRNIKIGDVSQTEQVETEKELI
mgnify:CR=1 FL=1